MIREAVAADAHALVELGRQMHAESPRYRGLSFDAERVRALLLTQIESPAGLVLVADVGGEIVGGFVAYVSPHWFSSDVVAGELALFVQPDRRGGMVAFRLIKRYQEWARSQGARLIQAGTTAGICDRLAVRLYERAGFVSRGTVMGC